jgi:hypothetical protein
MVALRLCFGSAICPPKVKHFSSRFLQFGPQRKACEGYLRIQGNVSMSNQNDQGNNEQPTGATFQLDANDPRRTDNRGGLEATFPTPEGASAPSANTDDRIAPDEGTTGANVSAVETTHDVGASGTGQASSGQLNMGTTGMAAPDSGPPGVGPVEGSQSGATAPKVEMTDIGLMDVNTTDIGVLGEPTDGADDVPA